MSIVINKQTYYRTAEVCRMAGIGRSTLFRWLQEGALFDVEYRDCRGWRLFTEAQVEAVKMKTTQVVVISRGSENSHSSRNV